MNNIIAYVFGNLKRILVFSKVHDNSKLVIENLFDNISLHQNMVNMIT
jgi:hypothetical protein